MNGHLLFVDDVCKGKVFPIRKMTEGGKHCDGNLACIAVAP